MHPLRTHERPTSCFNVRIICLICSASCANLGVSAGVLGTVDTMGMVTAGTSGADPRNPDVRFDCVCGCACGLDARFGFTGDWDGGAEERNADVMGAPCDGEAEERDGFYMTPTFMHVGIPSTSIMRIRTC